MLSFMAFSGLKENQIKEEIEASILGTRFPVKTPCNNKKNMIF